MVYVKQCNSVRPAFVLEAARADTVVDLMYLYIPMGLERQAKIQQSVLGRFCCHKLAWCFLKVANDKLGVRYAQEACTCTMPEAARNRDVVLQEWHDRAGQLNRCYPIVLEQIPTCVVPSGALVRQILDEIAGVEIGGCAPDER